MDNIKNDESVTELNFGIRLIQKSGMLTFGTDAFLISALASTHGRDTAVDLGAGSGVISLLMAGRGVFTHIDAVERATEVCAVAERNISLNRLEDKISCIECDVRDYGGRDLDVAVSNPPYMKKGSGIENRDTLNNDARREHHGTIYDFARAASRSLRVGGRFFCVYRPDRLPDLICAMREGGIEPKLLLPVCHMAGRAPSLILCEGVKGGKSELKYTKSLILNDPNGQRTADAAYIYEHCRMPDALFC